MDIRDVTEMISSGVDIIDTQVIDTYFKLLVCLKLVLPFGGINKVTCSTLPLLLGTINLNMYCCGQTLLSASLLLKLSNCDVV